MNNKQKYNKVFVDTFSLKEESLKKNIKYNSINEWDSVGHMTMIGNLEETFNIVFEMDDIIDFSSYKTGIEILKKYKIKV